jgi:hypothetical protein
MSKEEKQLAQIVKALKSSKLPVSLIKSQLEKQCHDEVIKQITKEPTKWTSPEVIIADIYTKPNLVVVFQLTGLSINTIVEKAWSEVQHGNS